MASKSAVGKGTILSIGSGGGSETFTAVAEVTDIKGLSYKMGSVDSTSLDSTNSEVIATLPDYGEVSMTGKMLPLDPGQLSIASTFAAGTMRDFTLQLPKAGGQATTGDKYAFTGLITEYSPFTDVSPTKPLEFSFKVKVNALPTKTAGS